MAMQQLAACGLVSRSWPSPSACREDSSKSFIRHRHALRLSTRASSSTGDAATTEVGKDDDQEVVVESEGGADDSFEDRLAKLRRRVNSGTGAKAEKRKARKSGDYVSLASAPAKGKKENTVMLPPASLKDPVSAGLSVELGFNSYSERLNGRFAALGLAAFLLVELATGTSFLKYHGSSVIALQAYFMLAVSAIFIKYEKEKSSIWPGPRS